MPGLASAERLIQHLNATAQDSSKALTQMIKEKQLEGIELRNKQLREKSDAAAGQWGSYFVPDSPGAAGAAAGTPEAGGAPTPSSPITPTQSEAEAIKKSTEMFGPPPAGSSTNDPNLEFINPGTPTAAPAVAPAAATQPDVLDQNYDTGDQSRADTVDDPIQLAGGEAGDTMTDAPPPEAAAVARATGAPETPPSSMQATRRARPAPEPDGTTDVPPGEKPFYTDDSDIGVPQKFKLTDSQALRAARTTSITVGGQTGHVNPQAVDDLAHAGAERSSSS